MSDVEAAVVEHVRGFPGVLSVYPLFSGLHRQFSEPTRQSYCVIVDPWRDGRDSREVGLLRFLSGNDLVWQSSKFRSYVGSHKAYTGLLDNDDRIALSDPNLLNWLRYMVERDTGRLVEMLEKSL